MPAFNQRSCEKELLDGNNLSFHDVTHNMQELDVINRRLGGHKVTIAGIKFLTRLQPQGEKIIHIVEIGCGGGDNLRVISNWAAHFQIQVYLTGIDINTECIKYAKGLASNEGIEFICSDYRLIKFEERPDIIFSSLFCHHFSNEEIISMLQWMQQNNKQGFFINDLHRHPVAYYSILLLTKIFSKSRLVKNDAPLSVLRAFQKKDWVYLLNQSCIPYTTITWKWAFRWLITSRK